MIKPEDVTVLDETDIDVLAKVEAHIDAALREQRGRYRTSLFYSIEDMTFDDRIWTEILRRYTAARWIVSVAYRGEEQRDLLTIEHPAIAMSNIRVP